LATRPSELFAISAAVLLGLSFLSRLSPGQAGISIAVRNVGYVFPPSTVFLAMASFLCFFAAISSRWPLSLNNRAAVWHYWITAAAIAAFWFCFYFFAFHATRESDLTVRQTAALLGQFISMMVILLAQTIFVANLAFAVVRFQNFNASH
jgi:hypothetical protein